MNYIYDILLCFNEKYYDFYEWDDVIHIKKIPIIKISNEQMEIINNNKVIIDLNVNNKTEVFNNKNINGCILFSDDYALGIILDRNGLIKERSSILFDDMEDIIDNDLEEIKLNIQVLEPIYFNTLIKEDYYLNNYIIKEIDKLIKNKEYSKLKYIYYECFNIKEEDINKVIKKIKNNLKNNFLIYGNKIYDILKLTIK